MRVVSSDSLPTSGGRIPGIRAASIVLPVPGGPTINILCEPAAGDRDRPLDRLLPAHFAKIQMRRDCDAW